MQRFFDIALSFLFIIVFLPLFIPIIFCLRFTGEGEIFYFQERIGVDMKTFNVIKFATMLKDSPNIGAGAVTLKGDPRVLPVGKFLRKTKINELPQLLNILLGDMSFVGPRPLMPKQFLLYSNEDQAIIAKMRPGLTGAGSIIFRNEEKYFDEGSDPITVYKTIITPSKALVERWYFENRNMYLYFKLIFLTVFAVLRPNKDFFGFLSEETRESILQLLSKD